MQQRSRYAISVRDRSIVKCDVSIVKIVSYSADALSDLFRHRNRAAQIMAKIERYSKTGAGDVKSLTGSSAKRLRVGDFRVIFEETDGEIAVSRIGPRGGVYD